MLRLGFGIAVCAVVLAMPATTVAGLQGGVVMTWTINNDQRQALVFAPAATTTSAVKHPLVFVFHGHGGKMGGTSLQFHIQTLWPQAIVVYPQGLNGVSPHDPSGSLPGWQFKAGDDGDRDLMFFDTMVATLSQKYAVDPRRIYTTGFSNGGVFSYLLWAERAKTIAAVGEVAGRLDPAETLTTPRALLAVAGTHDTTDPYAQQVDSINLARTADHATGAGVPCGQGCTVYPSAGGNKTPVKTLIHQGGHLVPPWAPAQIVKFFKLHPQP
jgi:polyhydroxybutyrate depolymerase